MCQHFYLYIRYLCRPNFRVLCQHRHSSPHVLTRFTDLSCWPDWPDLQNVHANPMYFMCIDSAPVVCPTMSDFSFVSFHGAMYGRPITVNRERVFKETWRNLATCLVFWLISVLPCFQLCSMFCPLNSHLKRPFLPEHDCMLSSDRAVWWVGQSLNSRCRFSFCSSFSRLWFIFFRQGIDGNSHSSLDLIFFHVESEHKGVTQLSKHITHAQQQRPESLTVTLTCYACKYTVCTSGGVYVPCIYM